MEDIKGYGFRPTDEELIGYLQDITFDRDSLVHYITQLKDICDYEPCELPGLSVLQPGSKVWYFIYSLNYKYQTGKLIKRITKEGFWKPTGKPRKVMSSVIKTEIGNKRSLVFHKGRPNPKAKGKKKFTQSDNDENKTKSRRYNQNRAVWVMHEYQLSASATPPNQKTFFLGKLMKQFEEDNISNNNGASNHDSPSNSSNQIANRATTLEDLSNKPLEEVEPSNDTSGVQNDTNEQDNDTQNEETYLQERIEVPNEQDNDTNRHNVADMNEVPNLTSDVENDSAVAAISRDYVNTSGLLIAAPESPNGSSMVQNEFSREKNNQHYLVAENESSNLRAGFENDDAEYVYPMDLSDFNCNDLCNVEELLKLLETPDNFNVLHNQSSTNEQDADSRNSLVN